MIEESGTLNSIPAQPRGSILAFLFGFLGARKTATLLGAVVAMSLLDLFGIAAIFPYLQVVVGSGAHIVRFIVAWSPNWIAQLDPSKLLLLLSASLIVLYMLKSILQMILLRYQFRQLSGFTATLTDEMVGRILSARYSIFQHTAASEFGGVAYSHTVHATNAIQSLIQVLNDSLFIGLLLACFLLAQPVLALIAILALGILSAIMFVGVIRKSTKLGAQQAQVEKLRHRLLYSIVSAIRDINIMGLGKLFDDRNREVSAMYAEIAWRHNLNSALPRLAIEFIVLAGLVATASTYLLLQLPVDQIAPMLGVAAIACVRTVPALSRLIGSINSYRFSMPVVERLVAVRASLEEARNIRHKDSLLFKDRIELRGIGFRYENMQTLSNINLIVRRGESIGIVGPSGAGKTTLLDLITGLQPASKGDFFCDGQLFNPFYSQSMQSIVGYVPQTITLLDESIAFNISFEHQPNMERLKRVLQVSNLEQFISSIPNGIDTVVGENGLRLSGGQRQRIGIARALYRDPKILIFDEATSSLDTISERELTAEINQLHGHVTMIIVTHRLSTIIDCDRIHVLCKGTITESGTHEELLLQSDLYAQLNAATGLQ